MRALIFDFDGVLVNSEPVHEEAIRDAVRAIGLTPAWTDWSRFVGRGDREVFGMILEGAGREADAATLAGLREAKSRSITARLARGNAKVLPGAIELMRLAAAAVPVGVCSGSRALEVVPVLRALGVEPLLRAITTADDVVKTKPDPEPYLLTARRLGVAPARCAVIEDTPVGATAAVAAGCVCFGVEHTSPAQALLAAGATRVVRSIDLLTIEAMREAWASAD